MDEGGHQREEVTLGSPHKGVGNGTADGGGEERMPQTARQLELGSQVERRCKTAQLSALPRYPRALRQKNKRLGALCQERLSPITDTEVEESHRRSIRRKEVNTDTEPSGDKVRSDDDESGRKLDCSPPTVEGRNDLI